MAPHPLLRPCPQRGSLRHTSVLSDATLSVVIPTLNEAKRIGPLLTWLGQLNGISEVIVSDGGSDDQTAAFAARVNYPGTLRVITGSPGRALQLNRGAEHASGDLLFFIHADCLPPRDSAYWIFRTLRQPAVVAGSFRTWHVEERQLDSPGDPAGRPTHAWWLHLADLRSRYTDLPYGDQGLFLSRVQFERVGGYPEQPLMEDLEFSRRLRRHGNIRTVPVHMLVSGRRFQAHPLRDTLLVNLFPALYAAGVPASRLAAWYHNTR